MRLRDYQIDFVRNILLAHQSGAQGVIGELPTGAGKTVCFSRLSQVLINQQKKVLIVVHRAELVRQTAKKLKSFGLKFGVIAAGFPPNSNAMIQIAMVQSISRRLSSERISHIFDYIIFDEAHLGAADSYKKIIRAYPKAKRLGVTATPFRLDGIGLTEIGSVVVKGPSISMLVSLGHLCKFTTYSVKVADLSGINIVRGDYDISIQQAILNRPSVTGDVIEHYKNLASGRSAIYFCPGLEFSKNLTSRFNSIGIKAIHIDGEMDPQERNRAINDFNAGNIQILSNFGCLTEGLDCPRASCIGMLRKTKAASLFRQMGGRGLRTFPGKDDCIIIDHAGNTLEHGPLHYDYPYSIDGERKRKNATSTRTCKECPDCMIILNLTESVCMNCGHSFAVEERKIKQQDGELVEFTEDQPLITKAQKAEKRRKIIEESRIKSKQSIDDFLATATKMPMFASRR